jgi:subtilisin family serine protease
MAEKVLSSNGVGYSSWVARGIAHAADNGAKIISMSLGSWFPSKTIKRACAYAWSKGCLLVAAAGNDGWGRLNYPAKYVTVIAVGAIDSNDHRAWFSNYGWGLELVAPGVDILSTYKGGTYKTLSGTSMACPHVSGVAALVWSYNTSLTNKQVRMILDESAVDLGSPGWDKYYGFGKVDAYRALTLAANFTSLE